MDNMKELNDPVKNLKKVEWNHEFSTDKLLSKEFINKNTNFSNFDDMVEKSKLREEYENFEELLSSDKWNRYVSDNTPFSSWEDMVGEAAAPHIFKKIVL